MELVGEELSAAVEELDETVWEPVLTGYIECALWSSHDTLPDGTMLESFDDYDQDEIASDTYGQMREDVRYFIAANMADFEEYVSRAPFAAPGFGHDFWLTRNGHGAGFWDRGLGELGDRLTAAAKVYGEINLYIGDDGAIHGA